MLNTWNERGFGGQFVGVDGGRIECVVCGAVSHASGFIVEEWRRLEGASDPDDMVKAVAADRPACGAGGNLVLGYGVNASDLDAEISAALTATHDTSVQTPDSSMGRVDDPHHQHTDGADFIHAPPRGVWRLWESPRVGCMSISDDDINEQPADDGLPPTVAGDADGTDGADSDGTDGGDSDGTDGGDSDGTDGGDSDGTDS